MTFTLTRALWCLPVLLSWIKPNIEGKTDMNSDYELLFSGMRVAVEKKVSEVSHVRLGVIYTQDLHLPSNKLYSVD